MKNSDFLFSIDPKQLQRPTKKYPRKKKKHLSAFVLSVLVMLTFPFSSQWENHQLFTATGVEEKNDEKTKNTKLQLS